MDNLILIMNGLLILVGILFIIFGYLIYFKNKYDLINNFKNDKSIGKYSDDYALRVGFIEFWSGIFFICIGVVGFIISQKVFSIISLIICVTFAIIILVVNSVKSKHK